jgi:hypothetical protein
MTHMIGGCVCGNLRYAADTEPIFSALCHCKTCQKQTGTAFRITVESARRAAGPTCGVWEGLGVGWRNKAST